MSDVLRKDKLEEAYELLKEADPRWVNSILCMTREANEKGKVYGSDEDSLSNIKGSEEYGVPAWIGASIEGRNCDRRARNLVRNGVTEGETLRNPILDRAVFDVHALSLYDEGQEGSAEACVPSPPWSDAEFAGGVLVGPLVSCVPFTHPFYEYWSENSIKGIRRYWRTNLDRLWREWYEAGCPDA